MMDRSIPNELSRLYVTEKTPFHNTKNKWQTTANLKEPRQRLTRKFLSLDPGAALQRTTPTLLSFLNSLSSGRTVAALPRAKKRVDTLYTVYRRRRKSFHWKWTSSQMKPGADRQGYKNWNQQTEQVCLLINTWFTFVQFKQTGVFLFIQSFLGGPQVSGKERGI